MSESESVNQAFVEVCTVDDLWSGEMGSFDVGTRKILILNVDGQLHSYDGICPNTVRLDVFDVELLPSQLDGAVHGTNQGGVGGWGAAE